MYQDAKVAEKEPMGTSISCTVNRTILPHIISHMAVSCHEECVWSSDIGPQGSVTT